MTPIEIEVLDLRGLKCPLPVLRARKHLSKMIDGQKLKILTTDPLAVIDIPHMCFEDGHLASKPSTIDAGHEFIVEVRRGSLTD